MEKFTKSESRKTREMRLSRIEKILEKMIRSRLIERLDAIEQKMSYIYSLEAIGERLCLVESLVSDAKEILTSKEACKYLGYTNSYLYKLTSENKIPYYRPTNGHILFVRKELNNWVTNNITAERNE